MVILNTVRGEPSQKKKLRPVCLRQAEPDRMPSVSSLGMGAHTRLVFTICFENPEACSLIDSILRPAGAALGTPTDSEIVNHCSSRTLVVQNGHNLGSYRGYVKRILMNVLTIDASL